MPDLNQTSTKYMVINQR